MQHGSSIYKGLSLAALIAMAVGMVGCGPPKYTDYDDFMKTPRPIVAGKPYVIEPPDSVRVIAPSAPEINDQILQVRPDGYVTLHLVGDIFAAGKTPTQLASEIEEKILRYYQDVTVQVEMNGFNSKFYYMVGEIQGPRTFTGRDTLLFAFLSNGVPPTAWPEKVVVLRPNERAELIRRMSVDMREMLETGDLKYNFVVEEGDIIWTPINPFAWIGRIIQNLLTPVDPIINAYTTPYRVQNQLTSERGLDNRQR
ncbi:MAG: polysaccharide biosynthesis/export family protein [Phycisphaeraceae bacterium]